MHKRMLRILFVEDSHGNFERLAAPVRDKFNMEYSRVGCGKMLQRTLRSREWDVVICCFARAEEQVINAIAKIRSINDNTPLIVVSGSVTEEEAFRIMAAGANAAVPERDLVWLNSIIEKEMQEADLRRDAIQTRTALLESETMHRTLFEQASDGIFICDAKGSLLTANKGICKLLGYTLAELMMIRLGDFLVENEQGNASIFSLISNHDLVGLTERMLRRKEGVLLHVEISAKMLSGTRLQAIVRDITKRKRAVESLKFNEERFRKIFEEGPSGIHLVSPSLKMIRVNRALCRMLGYDEEELIGRNFVDMLHPKDVDVSMKYIVDVLAEKIDSYSLERRYIGKKTNVIWANTSASLIRDSQGEPLYWMGIVENITEKKLAETALQGALSELNLLKNRLQAENVYLQEEIRLSNNFDEIIGKNKGVRKALRRVEQVAATDSTVLVLGETGTGKELIARAVHDLSQRKNRPLVKVNCAALPASLIESELFGYEKGAFTGASQQKIGRFELADKGTLFLDEIAELHAGLQAKLLRVLQDGEFERVGGTKTIKVDVRLITATNRDLKDEIRDGRFRADLYYRLNVFPVELPALRDRKDDIAALAKFFVLKYAKKMGKNIDTIGKRTLDSLVNYGWPGNIRELENIIERAVICSNRNRLVLDGIMHSSLDDVPGQDECRTLQEVEKDHIHKALKMTNWVIAGRSGAASLLGLHPNTLRSRMEKLGIKRSYN